METHGKVAKGEVETGESGDRAKWRHRGKWRQGKVAT